MFRIFADICRQKFAFYGFPACPLSNDELRAIWKAGGSTDCAYSIGCDVNAGFSFAESMEAAGYGVAA